MKNLPDGWTDAPIRTLMQPLPDGKLVHQGWSPQCEAGPARLDSDWGALKTTAIQDGAYLPEHNKRLPESLEAKQRLEVQVGDLLMTCAGPRIRCGVACLVRETPPRRFISGKMYRFRANDALIDSRLLEAFIRRPETKALIDAMKTGISESGMNITHEKFSQLVVPVAPRLEQKRIADKLETFLTRVDAVNTRLALVAPFLKRFRKSVLTAATSGRLTEEWRLLNGVTDPQALTLGELIKVSSGDGLTAKEMKPEGGVPVYGGNGINGHHDQSNVSAPTIVIGRVGFYCGSVHLTPSIAWVTDNALRVKFDPAKLDRKYLYFALQGTDLRQNMSSTAQPVISGQKIYPLPFNRPTLPEQTEIVRRVETLFAFADRLEARLQTAQTAANRLTPSLLAKAFRGELVPQDPNDEPASELLKRLAASTPVSPTKRGRAKSTKAV